MSKRSGRSRSAAIAGASATALLASLSPAQAARFCADSIEGGAATAETEQLARDAATTWWSSRAGSLGKGYEDWQAATDKTVACEKSPDGKSTCTAKAKPCLPDGAAPNNGPKLDL